MHYRRAPVAVVHPVAPFSSSRLGFYLRIIARKGAEWSWKTHTRRNGRGVHHNLRTCIIPNFMLFVLGGMRAWGSRTSVFLLVALIMVGVVTCTRFAAF